MSVAQCYWIVHSTGAEAFLLLCTTLLSESFSISDGVGVHSSSVSVGCQLDVFHYSVSKPIRSPSDLPSHKF